MLAELPLRPRSRVRLLPQLALLSHRVSLPPATCPPGCRPLDRQRLAVLPCCGGCVHASGLCMHDDDDDDGDDDDDDNDGDDDENQHC